MDEDMLDISEYLSRGLTLQDLNCIRKTTVGTSIERDKVHRKSERNKIMENKRGLAGPSETSEPKKPRAADKRMEMLLLWREARSKQKEIQKAANANKKLPFRAGGAYSEIPLIKNAQVKSFAEANHKFKAPSEVQRIELTSKRLVETKPNVTGTKPKENLKTRKLWDLVKKNSTKVVLDAQKSSSIKNPTEVKPDLSKNRKKWDLPKKNLSPKNNNIKSNEIVPKGSKSYFKSNEIKSNEIKPKVSKNYTKSNEIKSNEIKSNEIKPKDPKISIKSNEIKSIGSINNNKSNKNKPEDAKNVKVSISGSFKKSTPAHDSAISSNDKSPNVSDLIEIHKEFIKIQSPTKSENKSGSLRNYSSSSSMSDVYPMDDIIDTDSDASSIYKYGTKTRGSVKNSAKSSYCKSIPHIDLSGIWYLSPHQNPNQLNNNANETNYYINEMDDEVSPQRLPLNATTPKSILKSNKRLNCKSTAIKTKAVLFKDNDLEELFNLSPINNPCFDENNGSQANEIIHFNGTDENQNKSLRRSPRFVK